MAMTVSALSDHHLAGNGPISSPESEHREFTAVDQHSENETEDSSDDERHASPSQNGSVSNGRDRSPRKRKRSNSGDAIEYSPRHYDYSPPKRSEHPQRMADRALHVLGNGDHSTNTYYSHTEESNQHDRSRSQERSPHAHVHDSNDSINENGNYQEQAQWDVDESSNGQMNHDHYGQHHSSNDSGQGLGKRKRNFSNRTKTGCLTCRKRKKKCDEARPICNNCNRGAFKCEGYSLTRSSTLWLNKPMTKTPIPLQAKDGYPDENDAMQQRSTNRSPEIDRNHLQYNGGPLRPPVEEHDSPHRYTASPPSNEIRNMPSHHGHAWPAQHNRTGHLPHSGEHLPPLSEVRSELKSNPSIPRDMTRPPLQLSSGPSAPPPQSQPHVTQAPIPPPQNHPNSSHYNLQSHHNHTHQPSPYSHQTSVPPHQHPPPPPPLLSTHPPTATQPPYWTPQPDHRQSYVSTTSGPSTRPDQQTSTPGHMRMSSASFDYPKSGAKTFTVEEIERSRMLRQTRYNHLDSTLINERQRCRRALDRYNEACKFENSMSVEDARGMLWKVLDPSRDTTHAFIAPLKEKGSLAHGVVIEAPFTCTYGYNLKIMDDVFIGTGCKIDDAARVEIGARTSIGPNVTILTSDRVKDMVDRKGSGGLWIASAVTIASEVIIGANVVIYPGVRLERGATVEPNATVKRSLGPNETLGVADGTIRMT